jgi:hypothetical protein
MAGVPRDLHREGPDWRLGTGFGRSRRSVDLPPRNHAQRRGPDRVSLEPAARVARTWHGARDAAPAPGGARRAGW